MRKTRAQAKAQSLQEQKPVERISVKEKTKKKTIAGKFTLKCVTEVAFRFKDVYYENMFQQLLFKLVLVEESPHVRIKTILLGKEKWTILAPEKKTNLLAFEQSFLRRSVKRAIFDIAKSEERKTKSEMKICLEMAKLPYGTDRTSVLISSKENAKEFDFIEWMSKFRESDEMFGDIETHGSSLQSDSKKEMSLAPKLTATDSGFVEEAANTVMRKKLKKAAFFFQDSELQCLFNHRIFHFLKAARKSRHFGERTLEIRSHWKSTGPPYMFIVFFLKTEKDLNLLEVLVQTTIEEILREKRERFVDDDPESFNRFSILFKTEKETLQVHGQDAVNFNFGKELVKLNIYSPSGTSIKNIIDFKAIMN